MKRLSSLLKSTRLWGLIGTAVVLYFLVFILLGRIDVSGIFPTAQIARALMDAWPRMPFFAVQKESSDDGKAREIYYTVPTRQFTPQELARMGGTNATVHPATPK